MRTIDVARQAGVKRETLRYYEHRGLLPEPRRSNAGYRSYGEEAVRVVRFVKHAQQLGFSLEQIRTLLDLAAGGPPDCAAVELLATEKIAELEARMASLQAMRDSLDQLLATCRRSPDDRECALLESLD